MMRVALCGVLLMLAAVTHVYDLTGWRWFYSPFDDDWEGYTWALRFYDHLWLPQSRLWEIASLDGAYRLFPVASSWWAAAMLHMTGASLWGVKLLSAIHTMAAVAVTALLASEWYSWRAACVTIALLGFAWWWIAHDHTGYGGTRPALTIVLVVLLLSWHHPLLAGIAAGLGWWDYATARLAVPVAMVYLSRCPEMRGRRYWLELLGGCALLALPLFLVNGWHVVLGRWFHQTAMDQGRSWAEMLTIARMNALAFWHNGSTVHYLAGPLLDPITGVLLIVGCAWAIWTWRDWRSQVLATWVVGCFLATGGVSPHTYVADPRMLILVPPMVLLIVAWLERVPDRIAVPLVGLAVAANLVQWLWYVPLHTAISGESLAYRETQSDTCRSASQRSIVIGAGHMREVAWRAAGGDMPLFRDATPDGPYNGCVITLGYDAADKAKVEVRRP